MLLDEHLPQNKIATGQPVSVQENLVFIVDLSKLDKPEDIRADDLGSWICNGKRSSWSVLNEDGDIIEITTRYKSRFSNNYRLL